MNNKGINKMAFEFDKEKMMKSMFGGEGSKRKSSEVISAGVMKIPTRGKDGSRIDPEEVLERIKECKSEDDVKKLAHEIGAEMVKSSDPKEAFESLQELADAVKKGHGRRVGKGYPTPGDAVADVKEFCKTRERSHTTIGVGDQVVRNKYGENRYTFPRDNMAGIVVEKFAEYKYDTEEDGSPVRAYNGIVAFGLEPQEIIVHKVDLAFYDKV